MLWLPYAIERYLSATGDDTVLDEEVAFLEAPPLTAVEAEAYILPKLSAERASLFEQPTLRNITAVRPTRANAARSDMWVPFNHNETETPRQPR